MKSSLDESKLQTENSQSTRYWKLVCSTLTCKSFLTERTTVQENHQHHWRLSYYLNTHWLQINLVQYNIFGNSWMNHSHYKLHKFTIVTISNLTIKEFIWFIRMILFSLKSFFHKLNDHSVQVNAWAIISTVVFYCYDVHTPLAMARFPITSPPVARAYEAGTAARAVAAATVAPPVVVRCNGVSWTRE